MYKKLIALFSGTLLSQIIGILSYPIITRLFNPEVIGTLTLVTSVSTIVGNIAAFSLQLAIVISKSELEAKKVINTSIFTIFTTLSVFLIASFFLNDFEFFKASFKSFDTRFIIASTLISFQLAIELTFVQWLLREYSYRKISIIRISYALILNIVKIASFYFFDSIFVLVWVTVFCGFIKLYLYYKAVSLNGSNMINCFNLRRDVLFVYKRHRELATYRTLQTFVNSLSQFMPVMFLSKWYSIVEVGYFGLAKMLLELPVNLIGSTISSGLYPYYTNLYNEGKSVVPLTFKCIGVLFLFSSSITIFLYYFSSLIFGVVFSSEWSIAGEYAVLLSVGYITLLCSRTILPLINVFNMEKLLFKYEVFSVIIRFLTFYSCFYFDVSSLGLIKLYSISNFFIYLILIFIVLRNVMIKERNKEYVI